MIKVMQLFSRKTGVTVGQRKDGSRAVLFDDDSIEWFSASGFRRFFLEV